METSRGRRGLRLRGNPHVLMSYLLGDVPAGVLGLGTAGSAITGAIGGGGGQGAIRAGGTARLKQAWRAGEAAPRRVAPTCIAR